MQTIQDHKEYTDKYFLRTKKILESEGINPRVRYQVFARTNGIVTGMNEALEFLGQNISSETKVYALREGESFVSGEPLMKLEGRVQDLVDLETVYLGILAGGLTGDIYLNEVRQKARAIYNAAQGKPVIYFGARHFHYGLDEKIGKICQEEGFVGSSTDIASKAWGSKGLGTIPHALVLAYTAYFKENNLNLNPTVEAAKAFDRNIPKEVPRIVLIDTFNREIEDTLSTAREVKDLAGVRIDTCGENYTQGIERVILPKLNVPEKYLVGRGVKIAGVWGLRQAQIENGYENQQLVVSSGFNEEKTAAFVETDRIFQKNYDVPLFTSIGTGSIANPKMTTSDIVAYFSEKKGIWIPNSKNGRKETETKRLEEVLR